MVVVVLILLKNDRNISHDMPVVQQCRSRKTGFCPWSQAIFSVQHLPADYGG
jgi:hypothetical protein